MVSTDDDLATVLSLPPLPLPSPKIINQRYSFNHYSRRYFMKTNLKRWLWRPSFWEWLAKTYSSIRFKQFPLQLGIWELLIIICFILKKATETKNDMNKLMVRWSFIDKLFKIFQVPEKISFIKYDFLIKDKIKTSGYTDCRIQRNSKIFCRNFRVHITELCALEKILTYRIIF